MFRRGDCIAYAAYIDPLPQYDRFVNVFLYCASSRRCRRIKTGQMQDSPDCQKGKQCGGLAHTITNTHTHTSSDKLPYLNKDGEDEDLGRHLHISVVAVWGV